METQNGRIDWISKAKGLAILGVVAVHTVQRFNIAFVSSIAFAGMYCVQLFFIISAFLTFKSLDKYSDDWTKKMYFKYILHKIIRLMPVLYTACLWHLVMYCIEIGGIPNIRDSIWRNGFFAVTFLNGFSFHHINPWMNWYVGDLIIFIAVSPILKKIVNTPKKAVGLFAISVLVASLSTFILGKIGIYDGWYFYFWFPHQFPLLALGIVFYFFQKESLENIKNSICTFLFIIALGVLLEKSWKPVFETHVEYGILLLIFTYTLFSKVETGKIFDWLKVLGDNSYGIYLYHGCLLPIICKLIENYGFSESSYNFIICYLLLLVLSLLCSKVTNIILEKPFYGFMKRKFDV